jgi:hypothetical protein
MSSKSTLLALVALLLVGFGVQGQTATNGWVERSGTYERYVCTGCGLLHSDEYFKVGAWSRVGPRKMTFLVCQATK